MLRWQCYERQKLSIGIDREKIPAMYHRKIQMQSYLLNTLSALMILLTILNCRMSGVRPEILTFNAFGGILGAYYLTTKYVRKANNGIFGWRGLKNSSQSKLNHKHMNKS